MSKPEPEVLSNRNFAIVAAIFLMLAGLLSGLNPPIGTRSGSKTYRDYIAKRVELPGKDHSPK